MPADIYRGDLMMNSQVEDNKVRIPKKGKGKKDKTSLNYYRQEDICTF